MPFCRIFSMSFRVNTLYISRQLTHSSSSHYLFNAGASLLACSSSCEFCLLAVAPLLTIVQQSFCSSFFPHSCLVVFTFFFLQQQLLLSLLLLSHLHFFFQQFLSSLQLGHLQFFFAATFLLTCLNSMHISCNSYSCFNQLSQFFRLLHMFLLQFFYFGSDISISTHSNYACFYKHLLSFHLFILSYVGLILFV